MGRVVSWESGPGKGGPGEGCCGVRVIPTLAIGSLVGAAGVHTMAQRTPNVHFGGPQHSKHHIPRKDAQREHKECNFRRRKKKARNFHPSWTPSFRTPTHLGPHHLAFNFYWVCRPVAPFGSLCRCFSRCFCGCFWVADR